MKLPRHNVLLLCLIAFVLTLTIVLYKREQVWIKPKPVVTNTATVQKPNKPVIAAKQLKCLVRNAYYEAGNQGTVGRLLVTQVVINRAKANKESFCKTIYKPKQFSWTLFRVKPIPKSEYNRTENEILRLLKREISVPFAFRHATHYHEKSIRPYWAKAEIRIGKYKDHIFYSTGV